MAVHYVRPNRPAGIPATLSDEMTARAAERLKLCGACLFFEAGGARARGCRLLPPAAGTDRPCTALFERILWTGDRHPDDACPWPKTEV